MMFGNSGIIGNGKIIAVCCWDDTSIYLIKDPYLTNVTLGVNHNIIEHELFGVRHRESLGLLDLNFDMSLRGREIEILKNEPGLIQRLLTEDVTIRQMVRLVREKLGERF